MGAWMKKYFKKKNQDNENVVTTQLSRVVVSLNDTTDAFEIHNFITSMPIMDSKFLRNVYSKLIPNVDLTQSFACIQCGYFGDMEVPFNTEFFWPE